MAIVRWDPFGEILSMQRDMDRIFSRVGMVQQQGQQQGQQSWMPRIDIRQDGDDMKLRAELAGVRPEDVDIEITEGVLTLKGQRRAEEEREDEGWLVRETSYGAFQRSIALPESVEPSRVNAEFRDGILEVTVPGAFAQQQPQTTKVAIGGQQGASQGQLQSGQQSGQRQSEQQAQQTKQGEQQQGRQSEQQMQEGEQQRQAGAQREHEGVVS